ncbi:tyrosine-type recombinase/integrase [Oricola sp.]|uniref:tyrosine-type recombinase/integrase n=1 Tax=Oricola sp. TaxID=1979950 RepID=UPI00320BD644|nr:integrase arm-type DNA-binding domain-containing protein [Oricola sp.]
MARTINRLSAAMVAKTNKTGRYGDGGGLWLQVSRSGTKAWLFRFMLDGKARQMGLGSVDTFSLKEARERAKQARQLLADGIDPIEAKNAQRAASRAETAKRVTFAEAMTKYIAAHRSGWKSEKHAAQWTATLESYAVPVIGDLAVADIDTGHVMKILEPIWSTKTETASRLRGRIEAVLDWSRARNYREGENPARWRGHLDKLLPARSRVAKVRHHPAMPYSALPAFMERLRAIDFISGRALEFTILTGARTGETIGAKWSEIDFAAKIWTVPGDRMKGGRDHRVPLSDRAVEILKSSPREGEGGFVFPGARKGRPLSNMAMLEMLRGMEGTEGLTVHGFRSTFKDWATERTNFPRDIVEAALAHVNGDKVEAAYRRGDAIDKRSRLMAAWANYCVEGVGTGAVVPMRETA